MEACLVGLDERQWDRECQRLDKWLWCARFLKARADCARLVSQGLVRINRQPTDKPHARVRIGDVVTLPLRGGVRVIRVLALTERRGRPGDARLLYQEIAEPVVESPKPLACVPEGTAAYRRRACAGASTRRLR
jgi:ribosome-associated heat shock protein Hsp15